MFNDQMLLQEAYDAEMLEVKKYGHFADTCQNPQLRQFFLQIQKVEQQHADKIKQAAAGLGQMSM